MQTLGRKNFDSAEQMSAQAGIPLTLGMYKSFIEEIEKDFSPYDAPKDTIYKMKELRLGKSSIEEHVSKFKMLVTKSRLAKKDTVAEYFRETLLIQLQTKIMSLHTPPTTLDEWYKWAIQLQNNFMRMQSAINRTRGNHAAPTTNNKKTDNKGPRRFYFYHSHKDPNAMDVDAMTTQEREDIMRKGLCFGCKSPDTFPETARRRTKDALHHHHRHKRNGKERSFTPTSKR